jgi:hypothetical protein
MSNEWRDRMGMRGGKAKEMMNRAERQALHRKWEQDNQGMSYLAFRRTASRGFDCWMVNWCGMWLGIEADGYTHS